MLLALSDRDDARIRAALRMGAEDVDPVVRGEALCGLTRRDPAVALPLVRRELDRDESNIAVMNAAAGLIVAGRADKPKQAAELAEAAIDDGRVRKTLEALIAASTEA